MHDLAENDELTWGCKIDGRSGLGGSTTGSGGYGGGSTGTGNY